MRLLLCCEFYHPSRGGVQEVMRQIAERLAAAGHEVTVATTRLPERDFDTFNGVRIEGFDISGNRATGMRGEVGRYLACLKAFDGDAILIKAAQQWTFDAAWDALDAIRARKVFIPCGFSGLYEPAFAAYFRALPAIMAKFDRLIFYAERYRDVDFARQHGLTRLSFLPNGASEAEFATRPAPGIRARLGIPEDALLIMTVGTPINAKGHTELAQAFALLPPRDQPLSLILNGRWPEPPPVATAPTTTIGAAAAQERAPPPPRPSSVTRIAQRAIGTLREGGIRAFGARLGAWAFYRSLWLGRLVLRPAGAALRKAGHASRLALHRAGMGSESPPPPPRPRTIDEWIAAAEAQPGKQVLRTNLPRTELVEALFAADLFVFASNVEYSPLVLFEACAAGLPYLTVPVGNADEILRWTGGGVLCPAEKDARGYTRVDPAVLATQVEALLSDPARRHALGEAGRAAWRQTFNWAAIVPRYEAILRGDPEEETLVLPAGGGAEARP
jgi:glycosyltransferase involved in cell wall biosynthesis